MDFSDTESSHESETLSPEEEKERKTGPALFSVCVLRWCIENVLRKIQGVEFREQRHPSAYNVYMREKERFGGESASCTDLFVQLLRLGIKCRVVFGVSISSTPEVLEGIDLLVGNRVVSEGPRSTRHITVSVAYNKKVADHSLYVPRRIRQALDQVFIRGYEDKGCFAEHDKKQMQVLPTSKKEALWHPLYTIETGRKREIVYPKGCGWVGVLKDRGVSETPKSARQKEQSLRIYPISHLKRLVTWAEAERCNKVVEKGAVPYRVIRSERHPDKPILLYAPWQVQSRGAPTEDTLIIPEEIPKGSVYLIETDCIRYAGAESFGVTPKIGKEYNVDTGKMESVSGGLLITKEALQTHQSTIKRCILKNLMTKFVEDNAALLINIQIFSSKALEYFTILESL